MSAHRSNGQRVGTPDLVKVHFVLSQDDRAAGVDAENIWAQPVDGGKFRIDNVPFYVYGVSLGDIVTARQVDDKLVFTDVVSHSGHSTYRILMKSPDGHKSQAFHDLSERLKKLGCSYEIAKSRLIAIDVPPEANVFAVYGLLESGEQHDTWSFEEAHCGHAV